jgi:hypothetical protein
MFCLLEDKMKTKLSIFIIVILFALSSGCVNDDLYRGNFQGDFMNLNKYEERQSYKDYKREREKKLKKGQTSEEFKNYNENRNMFHENKMDEVSDDATLSNGINDETLSHDTETPNEDD